MCKTNVYTFQLPTSPNSCLIKLQGNNIRCLLDTGSAVTILNKKIFDNLKYKPKLKRSNIALHSANGSKMNVKGTATLDFKIAGMKLRQDFLIVSDLSRSAILGRDFMIRNKARILFDINKVCINKMYIPMERDVHLASLARTVEEIVLKPQTAYLINCRIKKIHTSMKINQLFLRHLKGDSFTDNRK